MSNRNLSKSIQNLTREVTRLCRSLTKSTIDWLLRFAFVVNRRGGTQESGFILPTATLLLLVVSLTVGALTYRAYTRNVQAITNSQQRVIYNAATPAIDRARSKLEYLFDSSQDTRYPSGGVPQENYLLGMMLNDNVTGGVAQRKLVLPDSSPDPYPDPYTLPGETRLKMLPSGPAAAPSNAWSFRTDTDGDGKEDSTVVYSILFQTPVAADPSASQRLLVTLSDKQKAVTGIVRHGPLTTETGTACQLPTTSATPSASVGWFNDPTNTSVVRKNFQVDVLVLPDNRKSVATTLEFHQDREISKGNKWGAWFRNDLEVFPGPDFRFNGAMHTEGNLIVGGSADKFQAYLISSKNSCLYPPIDNSEITVTTGTDTDKFKGLIAAGLMGIVGNGGGFRPHYQSGNQPKYDILINNGNDTSTANDPTSVYSDPVGILTQDVRQTAKLATGPAPTTRNNQYNYTAPTYSTALQNRIQFKNEPTPYIDDLSRADNRWGPKSTYTASVAGKGQVVQSVPPRDDGAKTGYSYAIPADQTSLTVNNTINVTASTKDRTDETVGLDGYWERRARNEGLRVMVGQRLELGNPFGWVTPRDGDGDGYISPDPTAKNEREGDPLYPPGVQPYPVPKTGKMTTIPHVQQQHRTLRDNLAAVQATALYHSDYNFTGTGSDYPFACLATTNHPGTPTTLRQSLNFVPTRFRPGQTTGDVDLLTDFFLGRGTNGWEFQPPAGSPAAFVSAIAKDQPLGIALRNLANFAGDPDGAFPPKQEAGIVHPYPALSMWGNFSNLRRALNLLDTGTDYTNGLSIADKTYIQTAACTVGMLAYEIDTVQKFDPTNPNNNVDGGLGVTNTSSNGKLMLQLGLDLYDLMNENSDPSNRVLPKALLKKFQYNGATSAATAAGLPFNPRDYYSVPPEAYIAALRQNYTNLTGRGFGVEAVNNAKVRMAELIMLNFQIRRDRTFGFRPSPSFGHYAIRIPSQNPTNIEVAVYPSACDPDLFALQDPTLTAPIDANRTVSINPDGTPRSLAPNTPPPGPGPTASVTEQPSASLDYSSQIVKARLGLSRLCGALNIPDTGYDLASSNKDGTSTYSLSDANQARPVVMPKFPALYYIFPQQPHKLAGSAKVDTGADPKIPDAKDEYDTRQPGTYTASGSEVPFLGLISADKESYVVDPYINRTSVAGSYNFQPVQTDVAQPPTPLFSVDPDPSKVTLNTSRLPISFPGASGITDPVNTFARFPDQNRSVFPVADLSVSQVAGKPRNIPSFSLAGLPTATDNWKLPSVTNVVGTSGNNANIPTNIIQAPTFSGTRLVNTPIAVPFLDRAFFDGRQLMLTRSLDLDVGMMRSSAARLDGERKEPLMPMSGIVYAFREDAVREDAIARPAGARMNARDPAKPTDPSTSTYGGITTKAVDYLPDPARRIHGFRLRNGRQVKRDTAYESGSFSAADNYRGLSFFTDQPLYIQGDLNRHQTGGDDTIGDPLEEFKGANALIRGQAYNETTFYNRGGGGASGDKDDRFANLTGDRWRPTELLADSISILSDNFCDGSISDMFVTYDNSDSAKGYQRQKINTQSQRSIYHDSSSGFKTTGLYSLGCSTSTNGYTSFQNSDLPISNLPSVSGKTGGYDWLRENPNVTSYNAALIGNYSGSTMPAGDYATPVKISRSGLPLLRQPDGLLTGQYDVTKNDQKALSAGSLYAYADQNSTDNNVSKLTFSPIDNSSRNTMTADSLRSNDATNVNSIVVSGIVPSQPGNTYGGLHNFPRFIENWGSQTLDYVGSFLQLSFSNYATAPFEMEGWEYNDSGALQPPVQTGSESIKYYSPPTRQWGYDVALQFAPAGPAASRFVIVKTPRNEFYSEPQVNDPYIQNLCLAARAAGVNGAGTTDKDFNCTN